jgi:hypothetical protein
MVWLVAALALVLGLGWGAWRLRSRSSVGQLRVHGRILDEHGDPLRGVVVSVQEAMHAVWGKEAAPKLSRLVVAEQFDLVSSASAVTLHFSKQGYYGESFTFRRERGQRADQAVDVVLKRKRNPVTLQRVQQQLRFRAPNEYSFLSRRRPEEAAAPSQDVSYRMHTLFGPDPVGTHGLRIWAECDGNAISIAVSESTDPGSRFRVPTDVRLRMTHEADGFARPNLSATSIPRREMFEAPVTGYVPELALSPDELYVLVTGGHGPYFFFRIDGLYGRGRVGLMGLLDDGKTVELSLSLLVQPDGSRNLEMDED